MANEAHDPRLDAQYNLRERHPDFQAFFDRWADESAQIRGRVACETDIPFGPSEKETIDLFPAKRPNAPLVLFIHGGYWQFLDKHHFSFVAPPLLAAGCAVAVNNYALAPDVFFHEIVRQNRAAIAWLVMNAGRYNASPEKIIVCGHSAGGHLTALAATTDWRAFGDIPGNVVKGGCAISGLFDLEPVRRSFLNDALRLDEEAVQLFSPTRQAPHVTPPMELFFGAEETEEFQSQSETFAQRWHDLGGSVRCTPLTSHNHFTIMDEMRTAEGAITKAVLGLTSDL